MKRISVLFALLFLFPIGETVSAHSPKSANQFSFGVSFRIGSVGPFYSALAQYGEWLELEAGFYAWRPSRVRHGWRPYLNGRWAWSEYGWYWVSYEPFGWATFHYGRWYYDDYYGWIWILDNVWGPAWVEWRYNDDYIGWAPLPPYASFSVSVGIRFTARWYAPAHYWTFVGCRYFGSPNIVRYAAPVEQSRRLIGYTRSTSRYEVDGSRIINRGVDRGFVERRGNTRFDRTEIEEAREPGERIIRRGDTERIQVYRPSRTDLERTPERIEARRGERSSSLDLDRVERNRTLQFDRNELRDEGRSREQEFVRPPQREREIQVPRRERSDEDQSRERRIIIPRSNEIERPDEQKEISRERAPRPERREMESPRQRSEPQRATPERRRDNDGGRESRGNTSRETRTRRDQ